MEANATSSSTCRATYSLLSATTDEEVARDFILFGRPDCTVVVMDATSIERNLNLALQVLEITGKVVVALNLMDEAERRGISVDHRRLARDLGVPVIPTVGKTGQGLSNLIQAISDVSTEVIKTRPHRVEQDSESATAISELATMLDQAYPGLPNVRWVAMRLLDGDERVREAMQNGELAAIARGETPPDRQLRVKEAAS